jgi:hypothetical protein
MNKELPRLSVVCVFNDPAVRKQCLDSSLLHTHPSLVEYLPIDNVGQVFTSAGAALNHGARMAKHEVVVLVHQDVHLHSVQRLRELAAHLTDETWGLIGACGVTSSGTIVGTLRDRVQLIGVDAQTPAVVDSVDEVLFMVRRDRLVEHPLSEAPELSWHAYAVEYGARMRRLGLRVGAASAAITHNSMTINLDKLDVAHGFVGASYPEQVPLRTTCGTIGGDAAGGRLRDSAFVKAHGWRKRWLRESALALRAGRRSTSRWPVLADIRIDVDTLSWPEHTPLHVLNLDRGGAFSDLSGPLTLTRAGHEVRFEAASDLAGVARLLAGSADASHLVTNLAPGDVRTLTGALPPHRATRLGVHERDVWLLIGPVAELSPAEWSHPRAVPLLAGV